MRVRRFLATAVVVLAITVAPASSDDSSLRDSRTLASVAVDLTAEPGTRPWLASAFEHNITRELSGFERITPIQPFAKAGFGTRDCGPDRSCRLRLYAKANVDIVLFGRVTDDEIRYELYQTWTPARLATGAILIGRDQTAIGLKHAVRDAFHPLLKHGGLLDQRPYMYGAKRAAASGWIAFPWLVVLGALAVLALPLAAAAVRMRSVRRVARLRSARRAAAIALCLIAVAGSSAVIDVAEIVRSAPALFAGIAGLAWGALVIAAGRSLFPPINGLTRIAHDDVGRIVSTWCLVVVQRLTLMLAVYAPFGVLAIWLGERLGTPDLWTLGLVAPAVAVFARVWLSSWVEAIAAVLDDKLVDGAASAANPWSREVADYLMGYVRRTGWDIDPRLLARVVFLPGKNVDGVISYGGGVTHARIVIDRRLLEMAMGELVEIKPADKPALWPDWTIATVQPRAASHGRRAVAAASYRGRKPRAASHAIVRKPLGQAATLLGHVVPAPGERVPLISDNPQDLAVVRALLSEHYPWDAPDPDEEFDATDPTDQDLLFGALVRELGVVERQGCQLQTVKLVLGQRFAALASRYPSRLADAYPALNFARHHFIQYLYYLWSRDPALLTARARADRLHDTSLNIFLRVREPASGAGALRRRLIWLSWFFAEPIVDPRETWMRRLVRSAVLVVAVAAAGALVKRSVDYHATYAARIEAQERARAAALLKQDEDRKQQEGPGHGKAQENQ